MATGRLFILGHPIGHSKSPAMYNAAYLRLGIDWEYLFADLANKSDAERMILEGDYVAINVTTPYKRLAFECASVNGASAQLANGANLIVTKGGNLLGFNVDGDGCISFLEMEGVDFSGSKVVVCGTGPTSISIMQAAAQAKAASVTLLGRDKSHAKDVLEGYLDKYYELSRSAIDLPSPADGHRSFAEGYKECDYLFGAYSTSRGAIEDADVIIDATPLGMNEGDPAPFDTSLLHSGQVVLDAVYGHGTTELVSGAAEEGARVFNGAGMLVGQAVRSLIMVCEVNDVSVDATYDEIFQIMASAAGFDF